MSLTATLQTTPLSSGYLAYAGPNGKTLTMGRFALVVDAAAGAVAGDIPASLFGLTYITGVSSLVEASNTAVYPASPSVACTSILTGGVSSAGTLQVETATVTAASGATSDGNLAVTVTSALFAADVVLSVALNHTVQTSAALVATAIRAAMNANATITANFTVGGSGASVVLTALLPRANDATLNIAIAAGLGVSAAASSADTTAGVAQSYATADVPAGTYYLTVEGY